MYLGLDLGTSGVKALLIDADQTAIAEGHAPLTVERPHQLWSEQDPLSWITACESAIAQVRQVAPKAFAALQGIAVSGQMHGATLLDDADQPLRPCILWNDGRSHAECAQLEARADFRGIGGNIVMAGFTAPKLAWVKAHEPEIFDRTAKVLLPKDFVTLWLTGEYISEMSDAAGTLWLDVGHRAWSEDLLAATDLTLDHMPRLVEGCEAAGSLRPALADAWGVSNVTVAGGGGDNAATACGLGIVSPGSGFLSLGTSGVLFSVSDRYGTNTARAVHSFCHAVPDTWHQMGVILSATDSLAWLAGITGQTPAALAGLVSDGVSEPAPVQFLPYLSGERTPHNAPAATGSFLGLRQGHDLPVLVQSVMEGVAYAFADCRAALESAAGVPDEVWVAGGGSQSRAWLGIIASVTGFTLKVPGSGAQGAALGAARLAAMATGAGRDDVMKMPDAAAVIQPEPAAQQKYQEGLGRYRDAWTRLR